MKYTIPGFRVLLCFSLSSNVVLSTTIQDDLSDMSIVTDFLHYVKPYIQSLQLGPKTVYKRSSEPELTPEIAIDIIVKELQPYLQDKDVGERLELEGDGETTIIEFTPRAQDIYVNGTKYKERNETEPFEENLRKYKKMRNKIKLALERESVSTQTKQIVTRTLDELIATLVEKQCPQRLFHNSDIKKSLKFRKNFLDELISSIKFDSDNECFIGHVKLNDRECRMLREPYRHCYIFGVNLSEKECKKLIDFAAANKACVVGQRKLSQEECKRLAKNMIDSINETINKLKAESQNFKNFIKDLLPSDDAQVLNFYNAFTQSVSNVLRHSGSISDRYKVRCTLVDIEKEKRKKKKFVRGKDACDDFRICSEELKEFLSVFYKSLNSTAVRTFRNYAAMYDKDIVADDSEEKSSVIATINHAGEMVERRVANVFIKTTAKITLDENKDAGQNIETLREYVRNTVKGANKTIAKNIESDLSSLRARLLLAIKQDILHNLVSDLGPFESDVVRQICSFFVTCKGNVLREGSLRKQFAPKRDNGSVFVKVEFSLDDELKNKIMNNGVAEFRAQNLVEMRSQFKNESDKSNSDVTRTTIKDDFTTTAEWHKLDTTVVEDSYETNEININSNNVKK